MTRHVGPRAVAIGAALVLALGLMPTPARAAVDMVAGARGTAATASVDSCSAKAKAALASVMVSPYEAGTGSGEWAATGPKDAQGFSTSAAAVNCFLVGNGYVVTLTCAVERPKNTESATDLCARIEKAFDSQQVGEVTWQ